MTVAIPKFCGVDAGRILEKHVGIILAPGPRCAGGLQALLGKCRSIGTVTPRCNCICSSQVRAGARALIGCEACANNLIGPKLVLRHDKGTKIVARPFLPHTAIAVL